MIIGVPKEIKDNEYRVGVVPSGVSALKGAGHTVVVETGAGEGSGIHDDEYRANGAEIAGAEDVWKRSGLIIKVKEPRPIEYKNFRPGLMIFTFFHLASDIRLAEELMDKRVTALAYETLETDDGRLPVLAPMSVVAGRLSVQVGAHYLLKTGAIKGMGALLGGVPGVSPCVVIVLGGGSVGVNAAKIALGLRADTCVLDANAERLRVIDDLFQGRVKTAFSSPHNVDEAVKKSDLLIGAAHVPGAKTPKLVTKEMVAGMKKGSVIVDVSIDQGGCVETMRPTTHSDPVYEVGGVIHYGVTNMPGAVPRTSTFALTNATLPYILRLAASGLEDAVNMDSALKRSINVHNGNVTHRQVAEAVKKEWRP